MITTRPTAFATDSRGILGTLPALPWWMMCGMLCIVGLFFNAPSALAAKVAEDPSTNAATQTKNVVGPIYVISVNTEIMKPTVYSVRRGVREARANQASAIVFEINSPGGSVVHTKEIINEILDLDIPTYAYVTTMAFSGGAMLSLACDKIFMTPGSILGGAVVVQMAKGGGGYETMGEAERAKLEGFVSSYMTYVAQVKNRDPDLARSMIMPRFEYKIGDEIVSRAGDVLVVNNFDAEKKYTDENGKTQNLISEGTVINIQQMLEKEGLSTTNIQRVEILPAEKIARWIGMLAPILIGFGAFLLYVEIQNPGFGLFGIAGIALLMIFFIGTNIAGLAGMEEVLVFFLGVALIILEIFIFPGFGLAGLTGLICMGGGLYMAMVKQYPRRALEDGAPALPDVFNRFSDLSGPAADMVLGGSISMVGVAFAVKYLPKSNLFRKRFVLETTTSDEAGYTSSHDRSGIEVGAIGIATSEMRPSGTANFNEQHMDVMSDGEFISAGTKIRVTVSRGNHVVVEPVYLADENATEELSSGSEEGSA